MMSISLSLVGRRTCRTGFSTNSYFTWFLFRNKSDFSFFKNMNSRFCTKPSKTLVLNSNIKPATFCFTKLSRESNKIVITICARHSIRTFEHSRYFHTSERRYLHPVLWTVLRPVLKFIAILTGRAFRKWWRELPPQKRKYFLQVMSENKHKIAIFAAACGLLSGAYYVSHLEETPITKRKRFMAFNSKQLKLMNQFEFQQIMQKLHKEILPPHHPSTRRVKAIVHRILEANKDIEEVKEKKWGVSVIDSSVENAFVLPVGHVFVFTGMLSLCTNDDELGIILAHEIAHCLQNHGAENLSFTHLLDLISIGIIAAIWAVVPSDMLSILTHWLYNKCMKILFELPYNRSIETEADAVGLQLAAKACFDVRESSAFWAKMAFLKNAVENLPEVEFLSTHPSHEKRSEYLDSLIDQAIQLRLECGCPKLKRVDPRLNVEIMAKALEATRRKYLQQYPKPVTPFHM